MLFYPKPAGGGTHVLQKFEAGPLGIEFHIMLA
jgi:hypothetical protein